METRKGVREEIKELLREGPGVPSSLIPLLQAIQKRCGYLPPEALEEVARHLKVPLSRVYGVATFYAQFRLEKRGKHLVQICQGTACHVRGAGLLTQALERELDLQVGKSNERWSLEVVRCVGCCSLAPVMVVDGRVYGRLTPSKAVQILGGLDGNRCD